MVKSNEDRMCREVKTIFLSILLLFMMKTGKADYDCIFEHLSTENGLSHGSVSGMLKDSRGFMWFATWDGINRFDGHTFKTFKTDNNENTNSASNRIETMKEDALGNIWIINYESKAFRLNRFSEKFEQVPDDKIESGSVNIRGIFPASSGDVWLLTKNQGVFRVVTDTLTNQYDIQYFHEKSEIFLPGNTILFVVEDKQKNIWINTTDGLICLEYNGKTSGTAQKIFAEETRKLFNRYKLTYFYNSITQLYFGTNKGKLLVFNYPDNDLQEIDFRNKLPITNIIRTNKGTLYLGTNGNGVYEYNEQTQEIINHYNHPNILYVLKTFADSRGMLWVESKDAGISKIDTRTGKYRHYNQLLNVNQDIRSSAQCGFMQDEQHTLWLTLKGGGFGYYDYETDEVEYFFNKPGDPNSRISNFVNCFYKDPSGVLWLSTYFKGIEKITFVQKKFRFIQPAPQSNLSIANEVRAMMEDSKGLLWVATKKQELFLLDKDFNVVKKIEILDGQRTGMAYALLEDSAGNIYVGTKGNGLFKLTRKGLLNFTVKHFLHDQNDVSSLSNDNIYSLFEDKQGYIWVGTYGGGVNLLFNDHFLHSENGLKNYPTDKGLNVRHIAEDLKGNIWVGTTDGLLFLNSQGTSPSDYTFDIFNKESGNIQGLRSNDVFWILCDKNNNIWMASLGGGLARLKNYPDQKEPLNFLALTKEDGLSSDVIFTITDDENGNLWMSTENGIAYYNLKNSVFRNYSRYDGIVNSGFSEAACATRTDGTICLGANNGLYSFSPSAFSNDQKKIDIVFTGFQLFGKEISPGDESLLKISITETKSIRLKYNQNVFGITWAGLDFKMQDKIHYAYLLEGFDNDWNYVSDQNQANYTKLPPGEYTFRVRFSNPELQEFNQPKSIAIEILPPFWETTWAYIIYLILIIALIEISRRIITSMIRLRNKVIIEKELTNIKLNFFTNISHELRTPLTLILGPVKELKTKENLSEKGQVYTKLIEHNAQRLLRLVNQLLDFRKVQSNKMDLSLKEVNLVSFTQAVCHNFDELAYEKNIRFSVHSSKDQIIAWIDEEKMDSIIYNLLSNAFKFTPDYGSIEVSINEFQSENSVHIEIKDSGVGVPKEQEESLFKIFASHHSSIQTKYSGTGIGLALSKELVELHNGELIYQPTQGGGATFCICLNLKHQSTQQTDLIRDGKLDKFQVVPNKKRKGDSLKETQDVPRILIVEDNHELRNFLQLQLNDEYNVEEAENGREGIEKALLLQPDIILTDVMMPEMDGIQLLEKIKNNFETSHIPVVLLTAKSSVNSKIEGLKYGADAYLTKPFHSEQLKAQLENLLHQRVLLRESYAKQAEESVPIPDITITDRDTKFLDQVREIIEGNLANTDFKIEDIYKQVGMGRSKFFDKMKGLTGLSPIDFIKEYRLNKAQSLLHSGIYNVTETSYLSGFTDSGYFSKCFKERFGVNPSFVVKK